MFFPPVLASAKVKELVPVGTAETARVWVGDQILKIADCVFQDVLLMMPRFDEKNKGESVSLFIKQADGAQLTKTVIAE